MRPINNNLLQYNLKIPDINSFTIDTFMYRFENEYTSGIFGGFLAININIHQYYPCNIDYVYVPFVTLGIRICQSFGRKILVCSI